MSNPKYLRIITDSLLNTHFTCFHVRTYVLYYILIIFKIDRAAVSRVGYCFASYEISFFIEALDSKRCGNGRGQKHEPDHFFISDGRQFSLICTIILTLDSYILDRRI